MPFHLHALLRHGLAGAFTALRLAHIERQMRHVHTWTLREKAAHRDHLRTLNHQMDRLTRTYQRLKASSSPAQPLRAPAAACLTLRPGQSLADALRALGWRPLAPGDTTPEEAP